MIFAMEVRKSYGVKYANRLWLIFSFNNKMD